MNDSDNTNKISRRTAIRKLTALSGTVCLGTVAGCTGQNESIAQNVGIYLGADDSLPAWERWFGRTIDYYSFGLFYDSWADYWIENWPLELPLAQLTDGRQIVVSFRMFPPSQTNMEAVAAGKHNSKYRRLATEMVENGLGAAFLRFGWEFNGSWAVDGAVGRSQLYIDAWKQVVESMQSVDGSEFSFVWAPNLWKKHMVPTDAYPGDEWVDQVGPTVYDKGDGYPFPPNCDSECVSERRKAAWQGILEGREANYGLNFWANFAREHGKPLVFPEYGVAASGWKNPSGGDNPYFLKQFVDWMTENDDVVEWHNLWGFVAGPHYIGPKELYRSDKYPYLANASKTFKELFGKV
jgi:hypothetical protein